MYVYNAVDTYYCIQKEPYANSFNGALQMCCTEMITFVDENMLKIFL